MDSGHEPLYLVKYRGPCGQCGGAGEIDNPAWNLWQERYRVARSPEETAAYREETARLEREVGPALLVCTHCNGSGQVEEEVPFVTALAGHLEELEEEVSAEVVAADADLVHRHDLFAAAAITGLMSGEMGRRLLVRPYHMGAGFEPSTTEPLVSLRFARMVASAADLVARAMLEQIAYWDSGAGPSTGSPEATSSSGWGPRTSTETTTQEGAGRPPAVRRPEGSPERDGDRRPAFSLCPTQPETPGNASVSVDPPHLPSGSTHTSPPTPQAGLGSLGDPDDGYDEPPWGESNGSDPDAIHRGSDDLEDE